MYGTAPPLTPVSNLPRGHSNGLIPPVTFGRTPYLMIALSRPLTHNTQRIMILYATETNVIPARAHNAQPVVHATLGQTSKKKFPYVVFLS